MECQDNQELLEPEERGELEEQVVLLEGQAEQEALEPEPNQILSQAVASEEWTLL